MKLTIKITKEQAAKILYAIPKGSKISLSVKDANKILGKPKYK